ncbi:receptor expression-enhancing protein 2-like isoform X5 [Heterodontus francisci]|uniref:receptor expression-enhancing protein 2-like isoform X5 n=1 Tax=Heterodontus francisci TaxID=7792 RepID=UPI00355C424E
MWVFTGKASIDCLSIIALEEVGANCLLEQRHSLLCRYTHRVVRLIFGTLYPAYASYKAVKTKNVKEYEIDDYLSQAKDRSYEAVVQFGRRGLNVAATAAVTAAAKVVEVVDLEGAVEGALGQGALSERLRSFSMQDLTTIRGENINSPSEQLSSVQSQSQSPLRDIMETVDNSGDEVNIDQGPKSDEEQYKTKAVEDSVGEITGAVLKRPHKPLRKKLQRPEVEPRHPKPPPRKRSTSTCNTESM